jgi:hypothetical protein
MLVVEIQLVVVSVEVRMCGDAFSCRGRSETSDRRRRRCGFAFWCEYCAGPILTLPQRGLL